MGRVRARPVHCPRTATRLVFPQMGKGLAGEEPSLQLPVCVLVAQSCPTLCNPMDCSLLASSVHGILQPRVLEWVAISFSIQLPEGPAYRSQGPIGQLSDPRPSRHSRAQKLGVSGLGQKQGVLSLQGAGSGKFRALKTQPPAHPPGPRLQCCVNILG